MLISAPVYSMQNETHFVNIYSELEDGTFKRTQDEPLRLLRDGIAGISMAQGELISSHYDRADRSWSSATVSYHYGNPQSFYQFLRDNIARKRFFVFSMPVLSGHLYKFNVHELKLKTSMSQRKIALLQEKYVEAIDLWSETEHDKQVAQAVSVEAPAAAEKTGFRSSAKSANETQTTAKSRPQTPVAISAGFDPRKDVVSRRNSKEAAPGQSGLSLASKNTLGDNPFIDNPFADKPFTDKPKVEKAPSSRLHFLRRFIFHRS